MITAWLGYRPMPLMPPARLFGFLPVPRPPNVVGHSKGTSRSGCELTRKYDAVLTELLHALHLDRFNHPVFEFRIFRQLQAYPLDQLASELDVQNQSRDWVTDKFNIKVGYDQQSG